MIQQNTSKPAISASSIAVVLIGFPVLSTLLSLLLLRRNLITDWGLDFFNTFWILITGWYLLQIYLIHRILLSSGWKWADIGFPYSPGKTLYLILGYLVFAFSLLLFIEFTLSHSSIQPEKINNLSTLIPKTTTARILFILMGLVAGFAEEIVYRGFAIMALKSRQVNRWIIVPIATLPFIFQHGLKSLSQFWWFAVWGITFCALFFLIKKLAINIIIHWLIILSAMIAVLQVIR